MASVLSTTRVWFIVLATAILIAAGGALLVSQQDFNAVAKRWHIVLDRTAAERAEKVEAWLDAQRKGMETLAENPSLALYYMDLQKQDASSENPAQKDYLTHLLTATSVALKLQNPVNSGGREEMKVKGGIAFLGNDSAIIATSRGMPVIDAGFIEKIRNVPEEKALFFENDSMFMGFLVPVYGMQADPAPETRIGFLLSLIPRDQEFLSLVSEDMSNDERVGVSLARVKGKAVTYVTPYSSLPLLHSERAVKNTPWKLIAWIPEKTAFKDAVRWRATLFFAAIFAASSLVALAYLYTYKTTQKRGARLQSMNRIITMLISLVDQRDPHASKHSAMVADLSATLAKQMRLSTHLRETVELAAKLMNIGKATVPAELLTRTSTLKMDELFTIRHSMVESANLLKGLELDGPVEETLKQTQEYYDGSGPRGLAKNDILISSRIITVANAFVAMISPRAYRNPMSIERALYILAEDKGRRFDPHIIAVLAAQIEKKSTMHIIERGKEPAYKSAM